MARFVVEKDVAVLDRGAETQEDRFIPVKGIVVDDMGSPDDASRDLVHQVMMTQCANPDKMNDKTRYYNEGDVIYTSRESGEDHHKFMIETGLLVK